MHELSLCGAIVDTVTEHAGSRSVRRVNIRVGHLRQVVPDTLQYCWRLRVEGTSLDSCELAVDHVPAVIECAACGRHTTLADPMLRCGTCDGTDVELVSGQEFLIQSIDLEPALKELT